MGNVKVEAGRAARMADHLFSMANNGLPAGKKKRAAKLYKDVAGIIKAKDERKETVSIPHDLYTKSLSFIEAHE
jgi:hypothetical protein